MTGFAGYLTGRMVGKPPRTPSLPILVDEAWKTEGLCRQADPEAFFPEKGDNTTWHARRVCAGCPVRERCLQWALDHDERFGIWGGLTARGRRELKREIAAHGPQEAA